MIYFQNKYDILKQRVSQGEIINTRIIKKLTSNKAIAQIKGYNVVIEGESLPSENSEVLFVISGFNNQKKVITMKMLKLPAGKFNETKFNEYIINQLLKYKLPVNSSTIQLSYMLYEKYGEINQKYITEMVQYLKFTDDIDLIFSLFELKFNNEVIKNLLLYFKQLPGLIINNYHEFFKSFEKNKKSDNIKDEILEKLRCNIKSDKIFNVLLKFNNKLTRTGILIYLYRILNFYSADDFTLFLPISIKGKPYGIKIRYKKYFSKITKNNIIFLKIEIFGKKGKVTFFLKLIENKNLEIRIKSDNKKMEEKIINNIAKLKQNLGMFRKLDINIIFISNKKEKGNYNLDLYI